MPLHSSSVIQQHSDQSRWLRWQGTWDTILGAIHSPWAPEVQAQQEKIILAAGHDHTGASTDEVKLMGYLNRISPKAQIEGRGTVVLLHGWESNAQSSDAISLTKSLLAVGFDCLRLNLRDHGESAHLNRGLFNATLVDEVLSAIESYVDQFRPPALYLVGNSLGGNFALRLGTHPTRSLPQLRGIVAVCPPLDPRKATQKIDDHPIFRRYFRQQWYKSLLAKQAEFPNDYDFSEVIKENSIMAVAAWLQGKYTPFANLDEYFSRYAISESRLVNLQVPSVILATHNDPVIPAEDFESLAAISNLRVNLFRRGGHLGFARSLPIYQKSLSRLVVEALLDGPAQKELILSRGGI